MVQNVGGSSPSGASNRRDTEIQLSNTYDEFNSWKTLIYADKCRAILDGKFLPPVVLHVYPTNACNANCRFCIMKEEHERKAELSLDVFRSLISSATKMGIKTIHISGGGEPTLYKHLDEIKKFPGFKVLSTNGSFFTHDIALLFNRVRFSLNAGTPQVHERVMGLQNFSRVTNNVRLAVMVNRQRYEKNCQVGLGFVVSPDNWRDVFDFCRIANDLEVDFVHIRPAYFPRGVEDERVREVMEAAYHLCEAARKCCNVKIFAMSEKFDGYWTERRYSRCLATPLHAVVTATGELIVCQDVFIRFGDLSKQKLEEIWGSDAHKESIAKIDADRCPRCVMTKPNEIIENVFIDNRILAELL